MKGPIPARVLVDGTWYDNPRYYAADGVSDKVLRTLSFPPMQWVIPDLVTAGLNLLVSPPKTGKSWLKLAMEQAVAYGGQFLGTPVGPARYVLSLALEDNARRVQNRARMLTPDHLVPAGRGNGYQYHFTWPGQSAEEKIGWLEAYLELQRKAGDPFTLVTVDTLRKFIGPYSSGKNAYDQDNKMATRLNELGMEYDVGIVVPHHTNKIRISGEDEGDWLDRISGSAGLAGSSTTVMYLERSRGADTGVLHTTSWDGEDQEIALRFTAGQWSRAEDLMPEEARRAGAVAQVLVTLRHLGPLTMAELINETRCGAEAVRKACHRLQENGEVAYDPASKVWERAVRDDGMPIVVTLDNPPADVPPDPPVTPPPPPAAADQEEEDYPDTEDEDMGTDTVKPGKSPGLAWLKESVASKEDTLHPVMMIGRKHRELPAWEAAQKCTVGDHRWIIQPELVDTYSDDDPVWVLDRNGSYLSACSNVPLAPNVLTHTGREEYDRTRAGIYLIEVPEWTSPRIGHPLGKRAARHDEAWVATPQIETLIKLGLPVNIRNSFTGKRATNLFEPFYRQARDYRAEKMDTEELAVFKRCAYGLRFLWTKRTGSPFWRPDWWAAMVSEANSRHWWKAWRLLQPTDRVPRWHALAMQNTDTVTWVKELPEWRPDFTTGYKLNRVELGAVKPKWTGTLGEWRELNGRER
jgi:AAA domain-containing protein